MKKTKLGDAKKLGIKKLKKEEPTEPQIKSKAGKEKEEDLQDEVEEEDDEEDLGDEDDRILPVRKSSRTGNFIIIIKSNYGHFNLSRLCPFTFIASKSRGLYKRC